MLQSIFERSRGRDRLFTLEVVAQMELEEGVYRAGSKGVMYSKYHKSNHPQSLAPLTPVQCDCICAVGTVGSFSSSM